MKSMAFSCAINVVSYFKRESIIPQAIEWIVYSILKQFKCIQNAADKNETKNVQKIAKRLGFPYRIFSLVVFDGYEQETF